MNRLLYLAYVTLFFVAVSEATIGIFVKLIGDQLPILLVNFYRVAFAALFIFVAYVIHTGSLPRFRKANLTDTLFIGALIALQVSLFNYAMTLAPVANVVVFWSTTPFFAGIFSTIFLKERPQLSYIPIFFVALVGIYIAEPVTLSGGISTEQWGNLIALLGGLVYAALITYLRREGKTESSIDIFWFMFTAALYLLPALLIFSPGDLLQISNRSAFGWDVPILLWVVGLGVVSTGFAYYGISYVIRYLNATFYTLFDIISSPVIAAFLAFVVFNEMPESNLYIGGAILLASGAVLAYLQTRDR